MSVKLIWRHDAKIKLAAHEHNVGDGLIVSGIKDKKTGMIWGQPVKQILIPLRFRGNHKRNDLLTIGDTDILRKHYYLPELAHIEAHGTVSKRCPNYIKDGLLVCWMATLSRNKWRLSDKGRRLLHQHKEAA